MAQIHIRCEYRTVQRKFRGIKNIYFEPLHVSFVILVFLSLKRQLNLNLNLFESTNIEYLQVTKMSKD